MRIRWWMVTGMAALLLTSGCWQSGRAATESPLTTEASTAAVPNGLEATPGTPPRAVTTRSDIVVARQVAHDEIVRRRSIEGTFTVDGEPLGQSDWLVSQAWWADHDAPPYKYVSLGWGSDSVGGFGSVELVQQEQGDAWSVLRVNNGY